MRYSQTRFLIERQEYADYTGNGIASQEVTKFNSKVKRVQDSALYGALPDKLWKALVNDENALGTELQAFTEDYVKAYICFELAALYYKEANMHQTPTGIRVLTDGTSSPALSSDQSNQSARYSSEAGIYLRKMLEEWRVKCFTFDGVKYPPECNQIAYNGESSMWYFYGNFYGFMQMGNWQQGYPPTGGSVRLGGITTSFI